MVSTDENPLHRCVRFVSSGVGPVARFEEKSAWYQIPRDLARVVAAWDDLPAQVRTAILAMVDVGSSLSGAASRRGR